MGIEARVTVGAGIYVETGARAGVEMVPGA